MIFPISHPRPTSPAATHGLSYRLSGAPPSPSSSPGLPEEQMTKEKNRKKREKPRKYVQETRRNTFSRRTSSPSSWPSPPRAATLIPPSAFHSSPGVACCSSTTSTRWIGSRRLPRRGTARSRRVREGAGRACWLPLSLELPSSVLADPATPRGTALWAALYVVPNPPLRA